MQKSHNIVMNIVTTIQMKIKYAICNFAILHYYFLEVWEFFVFLQSKQIDYGNTKRIDLRGQKENSAIWH